MTKYLVEMQSKFRKIADDFFMFEVELLQTVLYHKLKHLVKHLRLSEVIPEPTGGYHDVFEQNKTANNLGFNEDPFGRSEH